MLKTKIMNTDTVKTKKTNCCKEKLGHSDLDGWFTLPRNVPCFLLLSHKLKKPVSLVASVTRGEPTRRCGWLIFEK
jgi:hypothetical protein